MPKEETGKLSITQIVLLTIAVSFITGGLAGGFFGFVVGIGGGVTDRAIYDYWEWFVGNATTNDRVVSDATTQPESGESLVVRAVDEVMPSVVSVVVTREVPVSSFSSPFALPFDDFFGLPFDFDTPDTEQQVGGGTGFIIDSEAGLILTNRHVVDDDNAEISIKTSDGATYGAEVLALDPFIDLAVLQGEDLKGLPEVTLGDSDALKLGQEVIAIGNSLGEFSNTVTTGVVSGIGRDIVAGGAGAAERLDDVIQTDAAINFGNSGGPLIDVMGRVIGINSAVSRQGQAIGFAIPINAAKQVVASVKEYGRIVRPYLGVRFRLVTDEIAEQHNLDMTYGALIIRGRGPAELAVIPDGPADKAGLQENDVILEVDNVIVTEDTSLSSLIQQYSPQDVVLLTVWRDGTIVTIEVTLEEYQDE